MEIKIGLVLWKAVQPRSRHLMNLACLNSKMNSDTHSSFLKLSNRLCPVSLLPKCCAKCSMTQWHLGHRTSCPKFIFITVCQTARRRDVSQPVLTIVSLIPNIGIFDIGRRIEVHESEQGYGSDCRLERKCPLLLISFRLELPVTT